MSQEKDKSDKTLNVMFKSMLQRDPQKRRVKPNQKNYALLNLDIMESSSDDEDYIPKDAPKNEISEEFDSDDHEKEEEEEEEEEEDDEEDHSDDDQSGSEKSESSSEDEENDENERRLSNCSVTSSAHDNKIKIKFNSNGLLTSHSISGKMKKEKTKPSSDDSHHHHGRRHQTEESLTKHSSRKQQLQDDRIRRLLICSICLGDHSNENDEIVECDCCSVTVHEACYGLLNVDDDDVKSLDSKASSASTEPWFCDACKSGQLSSQLVCELCPESGGIFKQTETGRWVHLVCALYINGVAFANTINLTGITLFEMNYERWGARVCTLCEDERLSRTGVCISCDAGMCKTYFHVSCAQRNGLLCEPLIHEESEVVDPFFAHCKQHSVEKHVVKAKQRNYLALQARLKYIRNHQKSMDNRIAGKLTEMRAQYAKDHSALNLTQQSGNFRSHTAVQSLPFKVPRALTSSCSAMRNLIAKADLMGMSSKGQVIHAEDLMDVRKKWHIPAAFNVEFVSYFLDREQRMNEMQTRLSELKTENEQLCAQEQVIRQRYEDVHDRLYQLKLESAPDKLAGKSLVQVISLLAGCSLKIPSFFESEPETERKASVSHGSNGHTKSGPGRHKAAHQNALLLKQCGICHKCTDQHTLALCDNCNLYYHFTCLDPPLTRMPRKTKYGGWQCSECTTKEEESPTEEDLIIPDGPENGPKLRLRENVRCPTKYVPDRDFNYTSTEKSKIRKRKRRRPGVNNSTASAGTSLLSNANNSMDDSTMNSSTISSKRVRTNSQSSVHSQNRCATPTLKKEYECCVCKELSIEKLLVKCDKCLLWYHFGCLNLPCKKSPRCRGYEWFCDNCESDDSDDDNNDEDDDEDEDEGKENGTQVDEKMDIEVNVKQEVKSEPV